MRIPSMVLLTPLVLLALTACSDIASRELCEPTSTRPCACPGGGSGDQTCLADQTFGECLCDDADATTDGGDIGLDAGDVGDDGHQADTADDAPPDAGADGHDEPTADTDSGGGDDPEPDVAADLDAGTDPDPDTGSDPNVVADPDPGELDGPPGSEPVGLLGICDDDLRQCEPGLLCTALSSRLAGPVHDMCTASCDVPCPSVGGVELTCLEDDNLCVYPCNEPGVQSGCPTGMVCAEIGDSAGCVHAAGDCIEGPPNGDTLGYRIADFTLTNCEGEEVSFHNRCGQTGLRLIYPDSVFCEVCEGEVGDVLAIVTIAETLGGELWWVLGEGSELGPVTVDECRTRSVELGLLAEDMYIDPGFETLATHFAGIGGDGFALPHPILVHPFDMSYQYDAEESGETLSEAALSRLPTGQIRFPYFDCALDVHRRSCPPGNVCTLVANPGTSRPVCAPQCGADEDCPAGLPSAAQPPVCELPSEAGSAACGHLCPGSIPCPNGTLCAMPQETCYWPP